jgi:hypothetical protein
VHEPPQSIVPGTQKLVQARLHTPFCSAGMHDVAWQHCSGAQSVSCWHSVVGVTDCLQPTKNKIAKLKTVSITNMFFVLINIPPYFFIKREYK